MFKHPTESPFRLCVPDFSVKPGELVAIVGRVGAGKSSLLQAVLGNMSLVRSAAARARPAECRRAALPPAFQAPQPPSSPRSQVEGNAHAGGNFSYVPQNPWCQNLTLRENIVFGQPWDETRYREVIHACALEMDLQILAQGDQSKVRARGCPGLVRGAAAAMDRTASHPC